MREERDEAATVSPSFSPLMNISSVRCGGVMNGHDNHDDGGARQDGNNDAARGDISHMVSTVVWWVRNTREILRYPRQTTD